MTDAEAFRERLYEHYVTTHSGLGQSIVTLDASRGPYLERLVRRYFPSDRAVRVLDVGCGDGALLATLREHGYQRVRGVDRSGEQVELARARRLDVTCADLLETLARTEDQTEDVVVAFDVIEHFSKPAALDLVEHAQRVLRPGGRFLVHVPNGGAAFGAQAFFSDLTHEICFTPRSIKQLMTVAGFNSTRVEEDTPTVHGVPSAIRWVLWQVLRHGVSVVRAVETGGRDASSVLSQNLLAIAYK